MLRRSASSPATRAGARHASTESLDLVKRSAADIAPDDPRLVAWYKKYANDHAERIALDIDILDRYLAPDARILEVGSIPLILTLALARRRKLVTGADLDPDRFVRSIFEHSLQVVKCDIEIEPLPLGDSIFDAVIFNEIFEHLRINPISTFSELRRVLRPDGLLFLSTPNLRSLEGVCNLIVHNHGYALSGDIYEEYAKLENLGHMGHVREYTTRDVCTFLERVGFHVQDLVFRGGGYTHIRNLMVTYVPQLRPFVTYIAVKR